MVNRASSFPIAERSGLIQRAGRPGLSTRACKSRPASGTRPGLRVRVAVNLSRSKLRRPTCPRRIAAALAKHQSTRPAFDLRITRSVAMEDAGHMPFFTDLAAVGVHISIDDFGSGYSSPAWT